MSTRGQSDKDKAQPSSFFSSPLNWRHVAAGAAVGGALLAGGFLMSRYRVCSASQYMVRTGLGIKDMAVSRKGITWPFQRVYVYDMTPKSYRFQLHNMSREKVPFLLPTVFTIAPVQPDRDLELFKNYARTMTDIRHDELEKTIRSIIHGETRVLTAEMTIEEMFADKDRFKAMVQQKIARDLAQFGLAVNNCNIEEMDDLDSSTQYFGYLRKRAIEGANNTARVEVANARKMGDIGEAERHAETAQRIAQITAETKRVQNDRDGNIAESNKDLSVARSQYSQLEEIARIEGDMAAKLRAAELGQALEAKRGQVELETRRANELVEARVSAESMIERAEAQAESKRREANAALYSDEKRAQGVRLVMDAQAAGLERMLHASGGNTQLLQFYLAQNSGLYVDLAKQTALAVHDMKPNLNVWNTAGAGDKSSNEPFGFVQQLMTSVSPILDVMQQQTNVAELFNGTSSDKKSTARSAV